MQLSESLATTAATSPPQLQRCFFIQCWCTHGSPIVLAITLILQAQRPDGLAASLGIQPGMQPGYPGPSAGVRSPQPAFRLLPAGVRPPEQAGVQQPAPPSAGQAPDPQLAQVMPPGDATWCHCHWFQAAPLVCTWLFKSKSVVCKFSLALLFERQRLFVRRCVALLYQSGSSMSNAIHLS